jgi:glutathione S-transferase
MKILYTPMPGLVHRIEVVARELGLYDAITWERTMPYDRPTHLTDQNSLSKVPTLITDDGLALFPGMVIYEHLESLAGPKLYPTAPNERWPAMHLLNLGEGLWDMTVQWNNECKRPEEQQSPEQRARYLAAIQRVLDRLETLAPSFSGFHIGHIAVAGCFRFFDFRRSRDLETNEFGSVMPDFYEGHPNLTGWLTEVRKRPSFLPIE